MCAESQWPIALAESCLKSGFRWRLVKPGCSEKRFGRREGIPAGYDGNQKVHNLFRSLDFFVVLHVLCSDTPHFPHPNHQIIQQGHRGKFPWSGLRKLRSQGRKLRFLLSEAHLRNMSMFLVWEAGKQCHHDRLSDPSSLALIQIFHPNSPGMLQDRCL